MPDRHQETVQNIIANNPEILKVHQQTIALCAEAGPLDARTRRLVDVALAAGNGSQGGVQFHVERALKEGIGPAGLRHVALLAVPALGFGKAVTVLSWIDDMLDKSAK